MFSPIEVLKSKGFWLTTAINLGMGKGRQSLQNINSAPVVGGQIQLLEIEVIDEDASLARVVEPQEEMCECALSCSGVSNYCRHTTRTELQAEVSDHLHKK